jgi:hypothetical protein
MQGESLARLCTCTYRDKNDFYCLLNFISMNVLKRTSISCQLPVIVSINVSPKHNSPRIFKFVDRSDLIEGATTAYPVINYKSSQQTVSVP